MAKVTQLGFIEDDSIATPPSGIVTIYSKSDRNMYQKDDLGVETQLTGGGGGGGSVTSVTSANADLNITNPSTNPVITTVQAPALRSATTTVNVSSATAPTSGQVLTATGGSAATWQTPNKAGPSFSAFHSTTQVIPNASSTKVSLNTEQWDTGSCFGASRFTPNVEGYYSIQGYIQSSTGLTSADLYAIVNAVTTYQLNKSVVTTQEIMVGEVLVYLNGSTDYVEMFVYQSSGAGCTLNAGINGTRFQGFLAKGL